MTKYEQFLAYNRRALAAVHGNQSAMTCRKIIRVLEGMVYMSATDGSWKSRCTIDELVTKVAKGGMFIINPALLEKHMK